MTKIELDMLLQSVMFNVSYEMNCFKRAVNNHRLDDNSTLNTVFFYKGRAEAAVFPLHAVDRVTYTALMNEIRFLGINYAVGD